MESPRWINWITMKTSTIIRTLSARIPPLLASNPVAGAAFGMATQLVLANFQSLEDAWTPEVRRRLFETPEFRHTLESTLHAAAHARAAENVRLIARIVAGTAASDTFDPFNPTDTLLDIASRLSRLEIQVFWELLARKEANPGSPPRIIDVFEPSEPSMLLADSPSASGNWQWQEAALTRLVGHGLVKMDVVDYPTYAVTALGEELYRRACVGWLSLKAEQAVPTHRSPPE